MDSENYEIIKEHKVADKHIFNMFLDSISHDDVVVKNPLLNAAIFTGFDKIVGVDKVIDPILDGIVVYKDCSNIDELPHVTFTLDGVDYTLTGHDYVVKHLGNCINGIISYN